MRLADVVTDLGSRRPGIVWHKTTCARGLVEKSFLSSVEYIAYAIKLFIALSSNPVDHWLDPFADSGITAVACRELNKRHPTVIERDLGCIGIIRKRWARVAAA